MTILISLIFTTIFFFHARSQEHTLKEALVRAIEMATLWKALPKTPKIPTKNDNFWKTISKTNEINPTTNPTRKLRKCTSLRAATSFTRVCLCAPISSYTEIFQVDVPPRRSYSYPRTKSSAHNNTNEIRSTPSARMSIEGRRIFHRKSLNDDVLMRRFLVEEEAMMKVRRRNEMEIIRKTSAMTRKKLGPSHIIAKSNRCKTAHPHRTEAQSNKTNFRNGWKIYLPREQKILALL